MGENDMDYDADDKSMGALRRQLRVAQEEYYRYKRYTFLRKEECCMHICEILLIFLFFILVLFL